MNVLVIGGSGRVGRYLLRELDGGHEAAVFDVAAPQDWHGRFYGGDMTDLPRLAQVMQQGQFDAVIHLALKRAPSGAESCATMRTWQHSCLQPTSPGRSMYWRQRSGRV